jgi:hypothetical protein
MMSVFFENFSSLQIQLIRIILRSCKQYEFRIKDTYKEKCCEEHPTRGFLLTISSEEDDQINSQAKNAVLE